MADASAALGIIGRTGLGKMRHIDTSYLWLQQDCIKENISFNKVKGTDNPADMNTKGLSEYQIIKYVTDLSMKFEEGRAELAPEVVNSLHTAHCNRFNSCHKMITKRVRIKDAQPAQLNIIEKCDCMDRYCDICAGKYH